MIFVLGYRYMEQSASNMRFFVHSWAQLNNRQHHGKSVNSLRPSFRFVSQHARLMLYHTFEFFRNCTKLAMLSFLYCLEMKGKLI